MLGRRFSAQGVKYSLDRGILKQLGSWVCVVGDKEKCLPIYEEPSIPLLFIVTVAINKTCEFTTCDLCRCSPTVVLRFRIIQNFLIRHVAIFLSCRTELKGSFVA